ncbi:MAG: hypothetical protein MUF18_16805 [Fimbriiglobus sp.]|jgi:hypothetical protein|nr:hypothetical protein [Fimbriiglobus sp.]
MRTLIALLFTTGLALAADKPKTPEPGKAVPDTTPLEATLEGTAKYTLDLGGKTAEEFLKALKGDAVTPPPKVDLKLVLKNTGKEDLKVWVSGDPVTITLKLTGKGAAEAKPELMFTTEFRLPKAVAVAAGKTVEFPIKSLAGGFRGASEFSYWTQPGEYELVATLTTAVSPAPKGAEAADEGFGKVQVATKPLKITVEAKK